MDNKERYRKLCATKNKIPVFAHSNWLDNFAENWNVVFIIEQENIIAALPYCWKGNILTKRIYLPDVSFYQSVLFFTDLDTTKKQKLTEELIKQLPIVVKSYFKFFPELNGIRLEKLGFKKEEYNTFISYKSTTENLSTNHKRNIQKGKKLQYQFEENKNETAAFALISSTFERQKLKPKINLTEFKKLCNLLKENHFGKLINCIDQQENILATALIVEDNQTAYYLFGGYNAAFKNSGAMTCLLFHAIQTTTQQQKVFNFCGSSKKSIATFFEGFGATKTVLNIWKKSIL